MRAVLFALFLVAPAAARAQSASPVQSPSVFVTAISVAPGPVVVISAAGPLPSPRIGVLHGPERIYLDLAGVSSRRLEASGDADLVATVRIAQHSLDPIVARVVIDLKQPCRYSLDASRRSTGHLELALVAGASSPIAVAQETAPRPKSGGGAMGRYAARLQPVLASLSVLREVLHEIDKRMAPPADRMDAAQAQLGHLRETLELVRAPRAFEDAHDLLKSAVGFGSTALTLTSNSTGPVPSNAASAAAGALLMLDRGEAELQKPSSKSL